MHGLWQWGLLAIADLAGTAAAAKEADTSGADGSGTYRFDVTALARAAGLTADGLSVKILGNDQVSYDPASKQLICKTGDGDTQTFQIAISDDDQSVTETATVDVDPAVGHSAPPASLTVDLGGMTILTASNVDTSDAQSSQSTGSSTLVSLISDATTLEQDAALQNIDDALQVSNETPTATVVETATSTATGTGTNSTESAAELIDLLSISTTTAPAVAANQDPVAALIIDDGDGDFWVGETVTFDASASFDPDGTIVSY